MSTKNTQNTEDMLDQTFANFDSQVTGIEEEVSNKKPVATSGGGKSNLMLFIAAGIAAVGAIAYIVVIKGGMLDGGQPAQQQPPAQVAAPAAQPNAQTPPVDMNAPQLPNQNAPVVPGAPALPGTPAVPEVKVEAPVVPPVAPAVPEVKVEAPVVPPVAPVVPTVPEVKVEAPVVPPVAQPSNAPAVPGVPSLPAIKLDNLKAIGGKPAAPGSESSASIMLAEELKSMFDRQTAEFKTELTDVSTRVGAIESAVTEQKDINKKVEERLVKLESGAVVPAGKSKLEAIKMKSAKQAEEKKSEEVTATEEEKPVVKQKYSKKKEAVKTDKKEKADKKEVKSKAVEKAETKDDSLLVDKSEPSTTATTVTAKKGKEVVKVNMPKIEVHSIYGGRAWVKNSDGSLATYEAGDTLPTGEKIKKINDDAFEIVTDKRTISK